ncbi:hypothetical protein EKG95_22445 [Salmonella enterica subsp. enterica serovar Aqua]|nr:hypothetical protein [Salmonella enterica subsp. enterica serovar Aqua]
MSGPKELCRQLRENPETIMKERKLKPGLLTEIPLEENTDMPEQNPQQYEISLLGGEIRKRKLTAVCSL